MTEPNVIRCLQCKESFDRTTEGAQEYLDHRETCPDSYTGYASNYPTDDTPKGAA